MAQKQGGKGKSSSPSDQAYWKRVRPEAQREKRMARHAKRQGLNKAQMAEACTMPDFPKIRAERPTRPEIPSLVRIDSAGFPIHAVYVEGVCVEFSQWRTDADDAKRKTMSRLSYEHRVISPISGQSRLIESRRAN